MSRKIWTLFLVLFAVSFAWAKPQDNDLSSVRDFRWSNDIKKQARLIMPDTEFEVEIADPVAPTLGVGRDDPLFGEEIDVGTTYYDYQHNGTIGKMIAVDDFGGIHVVWMKSYDSGQNRRHMVYNYYNPDTRDWLGEIEIDSRQRAGYGHVGLMRVSEDDIRAVAFYHSNIPNGDAEDFQPAMGIDFEGGLGAFGESNPGMWPNISLVWPKGAVTNNLYAHITATENGEDEDQIWQRVAYWRGYPDDADPDLQTWIWTDPPINIDTSGCISSLVSSSPDPESNKVIMAWHHNLVGSNLGLWSELRGAWQRNNDIKYVVLENGEEFDPRVHEIQSMTKIMPPSIDLWDPENEPTEDDRDPKNEDALDDGYGDIWRPYCDVDVQISPWDDDVYYGSFAACGFWERPVEDNEGSILDGMTGEHDMLWFWSNNGLDGQDTITLVADGWYFNRTNNGGDWHSRPGAWRMNVDRPSIAFDPDEEGVIFVTFVQYPQIQELNPDGNDPPFIYPFEFSGDTSNAGFSNAEVMLTVSTDYGITWSQAINVTETRWTGEEAPVPGECASEAWQSVNTSVVDGMLYMTYVRDTDAGGIPQEEGTASNCTVHVQIIDIQDLDIENLEPIELPYDGFMFHNYPQNRPHIDNVVRNPGVPEPDVDVTVTAEIYSDGDTEITSAVLSYYIDGDENDANAVAMDHVDGNVYSATIPGQANGTYIWYQVYAENNLGFDIENPRGNWYYSYIVRGEGELIIQDIQFRPEEWTMSDFSPYKDYEVTVAGVVTTGSEFARTYGAYAIQDEEDLWSGIFVRGIDEDLAVGNEIRVTGVVKESELDSRQWEYETYIDVTSYEVVNENAIVPSPLRIVVDEMRFANIAEHLEGVLVQMATIEVDTLTGWDEEVAHSYFPIVDASVMATENLGWITGIGLSAQERELGEYNYLDFRHGTMIGSVVGVFTENFGHYAIAPRSADDFQRVAVDEGNTPSPQEFTLQPVYPNPFNAITRVNFNLPNSGWTKLAVYDLNGRVALNLVEGVMSAGQYAYTIDANSLATGVYILRLETANISTSQKLVLVK